MEFKSLGSLALHLAGQEAALLASLHAGLEKCAKRVEQTAKAEIGHYQAGIGPFPAWADLAESTEEHKAKMGYPPDSPLLASGSMRASITHTTSILEAVIGSADPKMVYHEFGTPKMPARPVMGPALLTNKEFIRRTLGAATVAGLIGGQAIHASLGYNSSV
ncbi:phage protein, HK97 gp10 family [Pseudomonas weihenstephanensis]|uniref:phage protein, HK97 gp10 family n=1 Tax=Pseudomonas weihenstephanensis TaxID=1608994 RepID=UPI000652F2DF|nr:phage protein, HK97 gp10 family [Pseudomonas weihenstephanensis]KMN20302.1 phage protein, HK97 gp10 family [Pseudomonas weihenstephanensis]